MKRKNWRVYTGWYRPPSYKAVSYSFNARSQANAYIAWLAAARNWTRAEAQAYCDKMDRRKLIRVETRPESRNSPALPLLGAAA